MTQIANTKIEFEVFECSEIKEKPGNQKPWMNWNHDIQLRYCMLSALLPNGKIQRIKNAAHFVNGLLKAKPKKIEEKNSLDYI